MSSAATTSILPEFICFSSPKAGCGSSETTEESWQSPVLGESVSMIAQGMDQESTRHQLDVIIVSEQHNNNLSQSLCLILIHETSHSACLADGVGFVHYTPFHPPLCSLYKHSCSFTEKCTRASSETHSDASRTNSQGTRVSQ